MKDEDLTDITLTMSNMAKQILAGESIEKETVTVSVDIWKPLVEVLTTIADSMNLDREEILRQLVQEGLNMRLQMGVEETTQSSAPPTPEPEVKLDADITEAVSSMGFDVEGLTQGLAQMQDLASQMQGMQDLFNNVSQTPPIQYDGKPPKNSK